MSFHEVLVFEDIPDYALSVRRVRYDVSQFIQIDIIENLHFLQHVLEHHTYETIQTRKPKNSLDNHFAESNLSIVYLFMDFGFVQYVPRYHLFDGTMMIVTSKVDQFANGFESVMKYDIAKF
jgi:hypothetical protein